MRFKSKYYDKELNERQYIIEILLERFAAHNNTELPLRYCDYNKWLKLFKMQLKILSTYLKYVTADCLIAALNDSKFKTVYSLNNPYLKKNIRQFYREYKEKIKSIDISITPSGQLTTQCIGDFSKNKQKTFLDILDE